mgnify:CR=1 FL=1
MLLLPRLARAPPPPPPPPVVWARSGALRDPGAGADPPEPGPAPAPSAAPTAAPVLKPPAGAVTADANAAGPVPAADVAVGSVDSACTRAVLPETRPGRPPPTPPVPAAEGDAPPPPQLPSSSPSPPSSPYPSPSSSDPSPTASNPPSPSYPEPGPAPGSSSNACSSGSSAPSISWWAALWGWILLGSAKRGRRWCQRATVRRGNWVVCPGLHRHLPCGIPRPRAPRVHVLS